MTRNAKMAAAVLPLVLLCTAPVLADVKTRERSQVKFEGMLGRMVGMFGGKAAREGVVTTNAVRGDRKVELTDATGRIVDLREEKIYELDMKRRTYQVTTFDELRRRMREAQEKAAKEAAKQPDREPQEDPDQQQVNLEVDFDITETGQSRTIAGHDAREVVMTVTLRQKGRTLDEGGGFVMTSNTWMGPEIPAMKELVDFELRYWKAIAPEATGMSAEQMAAVMAMYPMLKTAMERLQAEGAKLDGTPLATTMVFETVRSKEQMTEQQAPAGGGRGIGGMLAGRLMKREQQPRSTVFTVTTETLEISQNVAPADLEIPAGFKERK
jgi:hypothetical protein